MTGDGAKVIVITGAGAGIGRATAELLAERGWRVVAVDFDATRLAELRREFTSKPSDGLALEADVTNEDAMRRVVETTLTTFGRIDCVYANAARMGFGTLLETSPSEWQSMIDLNLTAVYSTIRLCLPSIIDGGGGVVLATASDSAIRTTANTAAYVASKTAVIGLIRSIAVDYGPFGVRANTVVPGVTDTQGVREVYSTEGKTVASSLAKAAALSPLGRVGAARDVAQTVGFLCSDEATFITGATIVVDGGMTVTYGAD